jgi:hypothetical protein
VQRVLAAFIAFITIQILARLIAKPRALSLFKIPLKSFHSNKGLTAAQKFDSLQNIDLRKAA